MKITYDIIKHNLTIYEEARQTFDVLKKYELGEVTRNDLSLFNLSDFGEFYDFIKLLKETGHEPVQFITFKDLKNKIFEKTNNVRFANLVKNMSKPKFVKMLTEEGAKFDRLFNGRWLTKPKVNRRGRVLSGRRSADSVEGFNSCFVQLINWIIINEIDVYDTYDITYKKFTEQSNYKIKWYLNKLNFDKVPKEELEVSDKLISNLFDLIEDTKLNFRKFNTDFIINRISSKIKAMVLIPVGTMVKCKEDQFHPYNTAIKVLTSNNYYEVKYSYLNTGFLYVRVIDDRGQSQNFPFSIFEDVQLRRGSLLDELLG